MISDTSTTRTIIRTSVTELQDITMPNIYETTMAASLTAATASNIAPREDSELYPFGSAGQIAAGTTGGLVLLAAVAYILLKSLACNKIIPFGYGR